MEDKGGTEEDDENVARMSGYLEKKGKSRLVSIWHRYWFVLEGKRLTYYETQPQLSSETPPPYKGSFILTPATSVTASNSLDASSLGLYNSHHSSHYDIYILTPSRLITLRTKDINQHKQWMQALLTSTSLPTKDQAKNHSSSSKVTETTSILPLRPSSKHFRYSLTNLTTNDEKNLACRAKSSHTMDNRTPNVSKAKSGNSDNIINRYLKRNRSNVDEDSSSVGDDSEETIDKTTLVRSDDDTDFPNSPVYHSPIDKQELVLPTRQKVEEKKKQQFRSHECMDEVNLIYVSEEVYDGSQLTSDMGRHSCAITSPQVNEPKHSQAQGSKQKTRKFFTAKEPKKNEESSKSHKTFKKCKESEITQQPLPKHKEKQKTKSEQATKKNPVSKDDILFESDRHEQSEFVNDPMIENDHMKPILPPKSNSQAMVTDPESKSSKKMLKKKGKSKKNGKGNEHGEMMSNKSNVEGQSNQKSKQLKDCETMEEGDSKKKKKKINFFSKMLKGKKVECPEEMATRVVVDEKLMVESDQDDSVDDPVLPEEEPLKEKIEERESAEEEKRTIITPQKLNFGMKVILANDEELMKKLQSRIRRMESEQNSSDEVNASPKSSKKLPVPTPRERRIETPNKLLIPVITLKNSSDEDKSRNTRLSPGLPPRVLPKPPPSPFHDKPTNNSLVSTSSYSFGDVTLKPTGKKENYLSPSSVKKVESPEEAGRANQTNQMESTSISISKHSIMNTQSSISSHSDLEFKVSGQKSIPELALTATEIENTPMSEIDETKFCSELEKVQDATSEPSVDAIQDLIRTPSRNSSDLTANYGYNDSLVGKVFSIDSSSNHALETKCTTGHKETSDNPVHMVDELELLMNELDRINSSPLEHPNLNENQRPVSEEIKELSALEEDFITTYPIRRRRNSDPDYDIPRPHRLPLRKEANLISQDGNASSSTNNYDGDTGRQGTDSITIEATCFFGSGIDYSFDDNKYFGLNEKSDLWDDQNDDKIQVMNYMGSHSLSPKTLSDGSEMVKQDVMFERNTNKYLSGYSDSSIKQDAIEVNIINSEELKADEMPDEKCVDRKEEEILLTAEENVLLRANKINRTCRNERSRELHESEFDNLLQLNECMEGFAISRTLSKEELTKSQNPENVIPALLITETEIEKHDSRDHLENVGSGEGNAAAEVSFEVMQREVQELSEIKVREVEYSEKRLIQKRENTSERKTTSALKRRDWHEDGGVIKMNENEVLLRQKPRSEDEEYARKEHRTLRLSFATTETLIVEEEVLVATLKTTTTSPTALPSSSGDTKKENIEELVDEVVLDMDTIADDHFGSMQVQSCIQT